MRKLRIRPWAIALAAAALVSGSVLGFTPGGFLTAPGSLSHKAITERALDQIYAELGVTEKTKSIEEAIKQIADANAAVDDDQTSSAKHFDGENFVGGNSRLVALADGVVSSIKTDDAGGARSQLGQAFHTLQDFYSHSNWVETFGGGANPQLGRPGALSPTSPPGEAACIDAPFPEILLPCFADNITTGNLTSGYYGGEDRAKLPGKCRHGGFLDGSEGRGGVNKDTKICDLSPHAPLNNAATAAAIAGTVQMLHDLQGRMTVREFKLLLGISSTLAFAIDTTGSMGSVIAGVRSAAISIVDARLNTPEEPTKYVLSPFNDPGVGPLTVTTDANLFKSRLSGLFASGGGDCPELAMTGTLDALAAADPGGNLFLFTDASAKDASLAGFVASLASAKKIKIFPALFGSCSPYDPAYFRIAGDSGGQVIIIGTLSATEAAKVANFADQIVRNNAVDLASIADTLSPASTKSYSFPIDPGTTRIVVSAAGVDGSVVPQLTRPDGSTVGPTDPGVSRVQTGLTTIVSVAAPTAGNWNVAITGTGEFSLLVTGESTIAFSQFNFVEVGGRPGHQAYFPIQGQPLGGTVGAAVARVLGAFQTVSFEARAANGTVIGNFLLNTSDDALPGERFGNVTIPTVPFRVYATGTDTNGQPFQRVISTLVVPQGVTVRPPVSVDLGKGQTTTLIFQVKNLGPPDTFRVAATDNKRFITAISTSTAALTTGQAVDVRVSVRPPPTTATGATDTITFTAESIAGTGARNFAVITSVVGEARLFGDVNSSGAVDCEDLALVRASFGQRTGQRSYNPIVDLDTNGVVDIRDLATVARLLPAGTVCTP